MRGIGKMINKMELENLLVYKEIRSKGNGRMEELMEKPLKHILMETYITEILKTI